MTKYKMIRTLCVSLLFIAVASAHLCALHPQQRGKQFQGEAGDGSCYRRTPYCGGVAIEDPPTVNTFIAGQEAVITFQQNLNHWNSAKPGFLDVSYTSNIKNPQEGDFTRLFATDDWAHFEMVTQTTLNVKVQIPDVACDHCIMRFRYVSFNKDEVDPEDNTDAIFYNCADVRFVKTGSEASQSDLIATLLAAAKTASAGLNQVNSPVNPSTTPDFSCKAPRQWHAQGFETNDFGSIEHSLYYDADKKTIRWDKSGNLYKAGEVDTLTLLTDYNVADDQPVNEFVMTSPDHCEVFGANRWNDWGYGKEYGMVHVRNITLDNGDTVAQWASTSGLWQYAARIPQDSNSCIPVSRSSAASHSGITFTSTSRIVDSTVFDVPKACQKGFVKMATGHSCGGNAHIQQLRREMFGFTMEEHNHVV